MLPCLAKISGFGHLNIILPLKFFLFFPVWPHWPPLRCKSCLCFTLRRCSSSANLINDPDARWQQPLFGGQGTRRGVLAVTCAGPNGLPVNLRSTTDSLFPPRFHIHLSVPVSVSRGGRRRASSLEIIISRNALPLTQWRLYWIHVLFCFLALMSVWGNAP